MTTDKLLTVKDIADRLQLCEESIRRMIRKNKFPGAYKVNRAFMVRESDFEAWLETCKRPVR